MIIRNAILTGIAAILMITSVLPWGCIITQAQTETIFKPTDKFDIPENNSTINFAADGTYVRASLDNGAWHFVDLHLNFVDFLLNNSQRPEKLTLKVSAQDSNVTIRAYQILNITTSTRGIYLRYNITGQGSQTFNFGFIPKGGEWDIIFNGVAKGENDGWRISPDATITITGATANVAITYYRLPPYFEDTSNQPVYQQHSLAIITAVAIMIIVILTVVIKIKNRDLEQNEIMKSK